MVCARCGQMYAEVVPVYCVCGAPLSPANGPWEATAALPHQFAGNPLEHSTADAMPTTFTNAGQARNTMIWAEQTTATDRNVSPPPPGKLRATAARSRTAMLIGTACVLFALAGVALFGAVALAQHRTPTAATKQQPVKLAATATPKKSPTAKPNLLALQNWQQNSTCTVQGDAMHVIGTGSHQSGYLCDAPVGIVHSATFQAQATFVHGGSSAAIGIAVRVNRSGKSLVSADEVYLNDSGLLVVMQRWQGHTQTLLAAQPVTGAATGPGATNTLTVTTQGDLITIAVNGQPITSVEDHDTPTTGEVALAVWKYGQEGAFGQMTLTVNT